LRTSNGRISDGDRVGHRRGNKVTRYRRDEEIITSSVENGNISTLPDAGITPVTSFAGGASRPLQLWERK